MTRAAFEGSATAGAFQPTSDRASAGASSRPRSESMGQVILTINAGSSSVKFAAFAYDSGGFEELARGQVEGLGAQAKFAAKRTSGAKTQFALDPSRGVADHRAAMKAILRWLGEEKLDHNVVAVGHRVLHGGRDFTQPARVDAALLATLRTLIPLGELHEPFNILGIEAALDAFPQTPQVACFDTAFHRTQPFVADVYGLPRSYYDEGVRRYGFHGLSYEYIARRLKTVAPEIAGGRVVVAHLGNGSSLCAIRDGRAMATSMGLTPLDGVPMGTRSGQIDPGVLFFLMNVKGMSVKEVSDLIHYNAGLKGLSGLSQDMRVLEASDSPAAKEAIDYFVYRIRREIGSLAAALDGLDAIVFTGGIGENSPRTRGEVLTGMEWLGVRLDKAANAANAQRITTADSKTLALVVKTNEERMIAEHAVNVAGLAAQLESAAR
jgi:acetate kinase